MRIAVPREIKEDEHRVAMTPAGAHELVSLGHEVLIERGAGLGSSFADDAYGEAGALLVDSAEELWARAELLCKVKEPVGVELERLRPGLVLFAYLHLAASRPCTEAILSSATTAIAYETVQQADGYLPLLAPMSEVAGRMAPMVGAVHLMRPGGGSGTLLSGVPGVPPARVTVLGAGVAGTNAAGIAVGMGADVEVLDRDPGRLRALDRTYGGRLRTLASNEHAVEEACLHADLVIGAVLVPGARAPHLVSDALVAEMRPGSVLVDVSIDQGGCFESSRPTTHSAPTFTVAQAIFYCVANMPGAVAHSSTRALTNATLAHTVAIAEHGWQGAVRRDPCLASGVNATNGQCTYAPVAEAHGLVLVDLAELLDGLGPSGP